MDEASAKQKLFDAMLETDGDRDAAAEVLGVSRRTFYREQARLDMAAAFEKMGWRPGVTGPKSGSGSASGMEIIKIQVFELIRKKPRAFSDLPSMAREIFGKDEVRSREKVFSAVGALMTIGRIRYNEPTSDWRVT